MLLLVEGSTGVERENVLGGEGQKEFAPEEMEHIQVCPPAANTVGTVSQREVFINDMGHPVHARETSATNS